MDGSVQSLRNDVFYVDGKDPGGIRRACLCGSFGDVAADGRCFSSFAAKKAIDKGMAVLAKDRYQDLEEFYNELYPDKNRVSSYNDIHLPKSFRDTLTQTENSGLFSRTAVRREFGEIAGKKGRKRRKVKWIVVTSILITAIAGILWIQYSGRWKKMHRYRRRMNRQPQCRQKHLRFRRLPICRLPQNLMWKYQM